MSIKTKRLTMIALMSALAYVAVAFVRIPVVLFLKYEPKDIIITLGGFMFGPIASFIISLVVSMVEMITISDSGIIGCVMNVLASCSFACTAAFVYKKKRTRKGAIVGLLLGTLFMTMVMLLWNYFLSPFYMGYSREAVTKLLIPAFLPFNLLKGGINMALTFIVYKPLVSALRHAGMLEERDSGEAPENRAGMILVGGLILATCVLCIMMLQGLI